MGPVLLDPKPFGRRLVSLPLVGFFSHPGLRETELNIFLINGYTFAGKRSLFYSCKREIYRCCGCCSSFHKSFLCIYHFGFDCCKQISLFRACYSFEPTREGLLERAVYCCCCNSHRPQTSLSVWFSSLLRHPRLAFLIFLSPRCSIEIFSQMRSFFSFKVFFAFLGSSTTCFRTSIRLVYGIEFEACPSTKIVCSTNLE